jgi:hypothetical protein
LFATHNASVTRVDVSDGFGVIHTFSGLVVSDGPHFDPDTDSENSWALPSTVGPIRSGLVVSITVDFDTTVAAPDVQFTAAGAEFRETVEFRPPL